MKEIIKYLRVINSYTQNDIAQKLGITRQSYIKYENGTVIPSGKIINQMADIYGVKSSFIYENKIPEILEPKYKIHKLDNLNVTEPAVSYSVYSKENVRVYDAYFDGNTVKVLDSNFSFTKGLRFKLVINEDDEKEKKREEAKKVVLNFVGKLREYPENYDYREEYHKHLEDKYARLS